MFLKPTLAAHSISVVAGAKVYDTIYPNEDGCIILPCYEFGWEWEEYSSSEAKLAYLMIYARDWSGMNSQQFADLLWKVVCEHTGASDILIETHTKSWGEESGYIDHQAVEDNDLHWMFTKENSYEILKDFIFNPASILRTGNDNSYCPYDCE